MAKALGDSERALLEAPNFCHVATLRRDGGVHGVVAWVDVEGDRIMLNTAEGRVWPSNIARDPRVTLTVQNGENPYEFVGVRGRVVEVTTDGADEHIDALAQKYLGQDTYPFREEGEVRLKIAVEPEHVMHYGH